MNGSFVVLEVPIWNSKFKKKFTNWCLAFHLHCVFWPQDFDLSVFSQTPATHKGFSKTCFSFSLARACNQRMWRSLARARMRDKVCACLFPDRAGLYQPSPQEMTGCLLWSPCRVFHYSYYLWRREASDKYPFDTHTHMHVHRHTHCCCSALALWCSLLRALPLNAS